MRLKAKSYQFKKKNSHQDYFVRRIAPKAKDFEQAYWGKIVDPDGNVRDRLQERERSLENLKQELDFINNLPAGRILDVGCGLGYFLSGVQEKWEKYGVEISNFAISHASKWGKIHLGELKTAKYPNEYFDVVVLYHVIEHIEDPLSLILEVRRILKRGGFLILGTPDFDSGCARRFKENYRLLHDSTHISLFTNRSLHCFLRDYGFIIDRIKYPFFETSYFTAENLLRLFDTNKISPPFYGNYITVYCHKPKRWRIYIIIIRAIVLLFRFARKIEPQYKLS